ncbi:MAG: TATA-box-binding protein [Candidatus Bathyarchaeia archaeon]
MQKGVLVVEIENVVASVSYDHALDLDVIAQVLPSSRYNPQQFPALVYRSRRPKASMLIYRSGKVLCSGMTSERQVKKAAGQITYELRNNGIVIINDPEIKIQNMVASMDLGGRIDLEAAAYTLEKTIYDPDHFPGLVYRMEDPKATFILFSTGKAVCMGAKKKSEIVEAADRLQSLLVAHRLIAA